MLYPCSSPKLLNSPTKGALIWQASLDRYLKSLTFSEKMSALLAAIRAGNNRMIEHLLSYDIRVDDEMILIYMETPSFEVDTFMGLLTGLIPQSMKMLRYYDRKRQGSVSRMRESRHYAGQSFLLQNLLAHQMGNAYVSFSRAKALT